MRRRPISFSFLATLLILLSLTGCGAASPKPGQEAAPGVRFLGRLTDLRITESSGVAASRKHSGILWTHNDGGGPRKQILYAINRDGNTLASFPIVGAAIQDWEDIAIDDAGHLFLADIGNNDTRRVSLAVHEIDEPDPRAGPGVLKVKRSWQLKFPGAPFDCESLFVWNGQGYVVSKVFNDARAQIFRFPLADAKEAVPLELVATMKIESPVTGADISADGRLLALVAKNGAYCFRIDGDVSRVIKAKPHHTKFKQEQIEGCAFVADGLLATTEGREIFLFTDPAFLGR